MTGARFDQVQLNRRDLRQPFPTGFARRIQGQTVRGLTRRGKYLLGELSSGDTLVMHLGMSGWFRVEKTKPSTTRRRNRETDLDHRHDHVVFTMSSGMTVTFNDPRRFGIMDLVAADRLRRHASLGRLGPEPLSRTFDANGIAISAAPFSGNLLPRSRLNPVSIRMLEFFPEPTVAGSSLVRNFFRNAQAPTDSSRCAG